MKIETFDVQLSKVANSIRPISVLSHFERTRDGLNYYANKATGLDAAALVLSESKQDVKAGFALLAGLALEVLLKGILRGLNPTVSEPIAKVLKSHRLADLAACAGIEMSDDERVLLQALSEHVYWASRYPAPLNEESLTRAQEIFEKQRRGRLGGNLKLGDDVPERAISAETYGRLRKRFFGLFWKVHNSVRESAVGDSVPGR
jgi:hypothetical protein